MNLSNLFKNAGNTVDFKEGSTIFSEGTPGDVMYVVLDGEVEVWVCNQLVDVIKPGNILGEMALIDAVERSATALAKSDCRLAVVDQKLFLYVTADAVLRPGSHACDGRQVTWYEFCKIS